MKNRSFSDRIITFGTQLLCHMKTCFNEGPQPDFACGLWQPFFCSKLPTREFLISHISANNKDMKLILVFFFMFSVSRNPNMTSLLCHQLCV